MPEEVGQEGGGDTCHNWGITWDTPVCNNLGVPQYCNPIILHHSIRLVLIPVLTLYVNPIKTHDSESRGQEEAQQRNHCRELFTHSTALKLANALAKPPLKLSLSYYRPTMFLLYRINKPRMEEIGATIPKYQPLRDLWRPLCDYA